MKAWSAALAALLWLAPGARAADTLEDAARETARRIAAFAGTQEPVSVEFGAADGIAPSEAARAGRMVEAILRDAGSRIDARSPVRARVTLSQNAARLMLATDVRRDEDRKQWVLSWPRGDSPAARRNAIGVEKTLLWEQEEPVLDAAVAGESLIVLSVSGLTVLNRRGGAWEPAGTAKISTSRPLPRDPRGRLLVRGSALRVLLPGTACAGPWQPVPSIQCKPSDEPWPVESGTRSLLLAPFAGARNYFEGRIVTQSDERRQVPSFYTAAEIEDAGRPVWLFAGIDGRVTALDRDGSTWPVAAPDWGSDIAGAEARCAPGKLVLATRPGDESESVAAFTVLNRQAEPASSPVAMPGPVTALWPAEGGAIAVVRDANTRRYATYLLTIVCGA